MKIEPEVLEDIRQRGGQWAVYENQALDSTNCGHLQFLRYGEGCTFATPPPHLPDTSAGLGWKYCLVGTLDLGSGEILKGD